MQNPNRTPIGSLERLKELGMDVVEYGTCSEPRRVDVEGRGRVVVNRGCIFHYDCPWASVPMPDPDGEHLRPRPRFVKTRIIKPSGTGRGDIMRENYCACFQWHSDLKQRDGKNDEMTEAETAEGKTYIARGTQEEKRADGTLAFIPKHWTATIPAFPDPTEIEVLSQDVATSAIKKSARDARRQRARDSRLGLGPEPESGEPALTMEVEADDVRRAIAGAG